MVIDSTKTATYTAIRGNGPQQGNYKAIIKEQDYQQLMQLLQQSKFLKLKEKYEYPYLDVPGAITTITYNQGQTKTIDDYGQRGTKEL